MALYRSQFDTVTFEVRSFTDRIEAACARAEKKNATKVPHPMKPINPKRPVEPKQDPPTPPAPKPKTQKSAGEVGVALTDPDYVRRNRSVITLLDAAAEVVVENWDRSGDWYQREMAATFINLLETLTGGDGDLYSDRKRGRVVERLTAVHRAYTEAFEDEPDDDDGEDAGFTTSGAVDTDEATPASPSVSSVRPVGADTEGWPVYEPDALDQRRSELVERYRARERGLADTEWILIDDVLGALTDPHNLDLADDAVDVLRDLVSRARCRADLLSGRRWQCGCCGDIMLPDDAADHVDQRHHEDAS